MAVTARYTRPCNVMVTEQMRSDIDREAAQRRVGIAEIVRERLERDFAQHPVDSVGATQ